MDIVELSASLSERHNRASDLCMAQVALSTPITTTALCCYLMHCVYEAYVDGGTMKKSSAHFPRHIVLEKKDCARGTSRQGVSADRNTVAASWYDSVIVTVVSNADASTVTTVERKVRSKTRTFNAPTRLKVYNAGIQGVDRLDQVRLALGLNSDRDSHCDFIVQLSSDFLSGKWKEAPHERLMFYTNVNSLDAPTSVAEEMSPSSVVWVAGWRDADGGVGSAVVRLPQNSYIRSPIGRGGNACEARLAVAWANGSCPDDETHFGELTEFTLHEFDGHSLDQGVGPKVELGSFAKTPSVRTPGNHIYTKVLYIITNIDTDRRRDLGRKRNLYDDITPEPMSKKTSRAVISPSPRNSVVTLALH
ncbi:hypothetical protein ON010_g10435 [Phytophthora cinnamomi]|nr:hypothetical protein ON010_g10435 [Phytophthora cinnamomi]